MRTNCAPSFAALRTRSLAAEIFAAMSSLALTCTQAAMNVPPDTTLGSRAQERIKSTGFIERIKIVAAAHMLSVDENLRHGLTPAGAAQHFLALRAIRHDIEFGELSV